MVLPLRSELNRALFADLFQGQLYLPQSYGGKTAATVSFSKYERGEREQPKEGDWICPHVSGPKPIVTISLPG